MGQFPLRQRQSGRFTSRDGRIPASLSAAQPQSGPPGSAQQRPAVAPADQPSRRAQPARHPTGTRGHPCPLRGGRTRSACLRDSPGTRCPYPASSTAVPWRADRALKHVIVMGDLNCTLAQLRQHKAFNEALDSRPSKAINSYPAWQPRRGLDHILVSSTLRLSHPTTLSHLFSDHLPLAVEVHLPAACRKAIGLA